MNSNGIDEEDRQMRQLFAAVAPQITDRGFTDQAMRRIHRLVWIRRLASTVALVVALPLLVTVLGAVLMPAGGWPLLEGAAWDASIAVGLCLLLLLRVTENADAHGIP